MTGGTAHRAAAIGFQSGLQIGVLRGVQPWRVAGIAAREGRRGVAGLHGEVVAMIVGIAEVIAARGRIGAGDRGRSSRVPAIGIPVSRGSTGTSARRSRRRIG